MNLDPKGLRRTFVKLKSAKNGLNWLSQALLNPLGSLGRNLGHYTIQNREATVKKAQLSLTLLVLFSLLLLPGCSAASVFLAREAVEAAVSPLKIPQVSEPLEEVPLTRRDTVLGDLEDILGFIYEDVNPSVVSIQVVQKHTVETMPDMPGAPFFELPQIPSLPEEQFQYGSGSGFVWDEAGHIVTNYHVVADADKLTVKFHDGTTVPAEVVGGDPDSDLAVLKVAAPRDLLRPIKLGDSTQVRVGQLALAIGNPFGLENTMTVGFVSALGRTLPVQQLASGPSYSIPNIIQTDAPINPGNSGGVLVNDQGEVIGVTTAILSSSGVSAGIGFAVPSAIVEKVVPALIEEGRYAHAWLGISGTSMTPDLAKVMNLDANQRGALVIEIVPDGPAEAAGLQGSDREISVDGMALRAGGDVIVAFDDAPVHSFEDLVAYINDAEVGQKVRLTVLRDGREQQLTVTLQARPE